MNLYHISHVLFLYISNGYEICLRFISHLLETHIDFSDKLYHENNYKDLLMKYYHANKWCFPKYNIISCDGQPHERKYVMGVTSQHENEYIGYGEGISKKVAEQKAAKMALIKLKQLNKDQFTLDDIYYPTIK